MAKPFTIELDGLEKTISKLKKVDNEVADMVDEVLENAVLQIAGVARQLAPVDLGKLRASIQSGPVAKLSWEVVASAKYAPYIEFGTGGLVDVPKGLESYALQFKGKGIRKVNMKARPFLYPAFVAYRNQLIKDLRAELEKPR
jgi:HK97 gp10 family phage protein